MVVVSPTNLSAKVVVMEAKLPVVGRHAAGADQQEEGEEQQARGDHSYTVVGGFTSHATLAVDHAAVSMMHFLRNNSKLFFRKENYYLK